MLLIPTHNMVYIVLPHLSQSYCITDSYIHFQGKHICSNCFQMWHQSCIQGGGRGGGYHEVCKRPKNGTYLVLLLTTKSRAMPRLPLGSFLPTAFIQSTKWSSRMLQQLILQSNFIVSSTLIARYTFSQKCNSTTGECPKIKMIVRY